MEYPAHKNAGTILVKVADRNDLLRALRLGRIRGCVGYRTQARSTYSDVSVLTTIFSPVPTKGGTITRTPLSSNAGL